MAVTAITVKAQDRANAQFTVHVHFFGRRYVEGLAHGDVQAVIWANGAGACSVVVRLFFGRNQVALFDHGKGHGVRAFGEILHRREHHDAVALHHVHKAVCRVADASRDVELDAGAEVFHGVRHVVHIAVIGEIDIVLAGADPDCCRVTAYSDGAGIRDDGEQLNLEAIGHLDVGQHLLQIVCIRTALGNALGWWGVGLLEGTEFLQVGVVGETNS